jgi:hypothetical protein
MVKVSLVQQQQSLPPHSEPPLDENDDNIPADESQFDQESFPEDQPST